MQRFLAGNTPQAHEIEEALLDFGFYHRLHEVTRMYAEYTNRNLLGYAGGVNEQPEEYWRDMSTMQWLKLYVEQVLPTAGAIPQESVFDQLRNNRGFGTMITRKRT